METSFPRDDFISAQEESIVEYEDFDSTNQIRAHLSITIIACFVSFIGNTLVIFGIWKTSLLHDVTWLYQGVVCFSVILHTVALPFAYVSHTDPLNWPLEGVYSCQAVHFFSDFGNVFMRLSLLAACGLRWLSLTSLNSITKRRPVLTVMILVTITIVVSIISSIPSVRFVFLYNNEFGHRVCLFNDVRSAKYKMWFTYLAIMTLIFPLLIMVLSNTLLLIRGDRLYAKDSNLRVQFHNHGLSTDQTTRSQALDPTMLSSTVLKNPMSDEKVLSDLKGNQILQTLTSDSSIVKDKSYLIGLEDLKNTLTIRDQKKATLMQVTMTISFAVCLAPIAIVWGVYVSSDFTNNSPALFHSYRIAGLMATTFPIHIPIISFLFSRHLRGNVIGVIRGIFFKI
ncbi:uncharacterized protein LOC117105624 [Anneissia japonica]|uniref:uncharacterized protein LOC117105624 n=1 Tax=Anneissia japonica TaxID=1529436 RepID=UPI00142587F7|nr:uncharacterized protein LOC117105624 [Anneissia japonica]